MALTDFSGKTALITGGASGIGFGLATALVERGASVALAGTDAARAQQAAQRLAPGRAIGLRLDVRDAQQWGEAVAHTERALGPIDLLVLNAGAQGSRRPAEQVTPEEWAWVWSVNVDGVYHGLAACLPAMRQRDRDAHVLITASIAALLPRATVSAYGASKAAALALAEAVRLELHNTRIGISVLCPAGVRTEFAETMRRHAPGADAGTFAYMAAVMQSALDPLDVARTALDALAGGKFYIFTHPEMAEMVRARLAEISAALEPTHAAREP